MKACAFCGGWNEDAAEACKECGTNEFKAVPDVQAQVAEGGTAGSEFRRRRMLSGVCGAVCMVALAGFGLHVIPTPIAIGLANLPNQDLRLAVLGIIAGLFGAASVFLYKRRPAKTDSRRPRDEGK